MSEKIKVGMRGQVVIPEKFRKKLKIERGIILEINATDEGLFLKPFNPVSEMKGLGKGVFGDPFTYQKKLRRMGMSALKICPRHQYLDLLFRRN